MEEKEFVRAAQDDLAVINSMLCEDYVDRHFFYLRQHEDGTYSLYDYDKERSDRTSIEILAQNIDGLRKQLRSNNPLRICSACGHVLFLDGYVVFCGDEYYCCDKCLHSVYSEEEWEQMCNEDDQTYWTEFVYY